VLRKFLKVIAAPVFLIYLIGIAAFTFAYVWAKRVWGESWILVGIAIITVLLVRAYAIWAARKLSTNGEADLNN
jgi:hypothetical protein